MTTAAAEAAPRRSARNSRAGRAAAVRPRLRVLTPPLERARRIPFQTLCIGLLALGLVALLGLNIRLSQGSYEEYALSKQQVRLAEDEQTLTNQLEVAQSPQAVMNRARKLGMVPSTDPVFVQLANGKLIGSAKVSTNRQLPLSAELPTALSVSPQQVQAQAAAQAEALRTHRYLERLSVGTTAWPTTQGNSVIPASPTGTTVTNGSQSNSGGNAGSDGAVPAP